MDITRNKLQDYLDGKLSEEENLQVQLFLAGHVEDPMVQELLNSQFDSYRNEADESAVRTLVSTRRKLGLDKDRRSLFWLAAAVIALLLAIPTSLSIGYKLHKEPAPVAWQELTVPIAETREVQLPDGTHLTLNAGSRVTWPDAFDGDKREIFLDGEVMASVAKDPQRPFIIHSGDVDVRVHGTTFDLKAYRDATMLEVVLLEGSVSLELPSQEGRREVSLTPGDIVQLDRRSGGVSMGKVVPENYKTFAGNRSFSFINTPLEDIASDLARSFGTPIVVADSKVVSQRFLAFFTNGEDLDQILRLLARNGNLRVVRSDGKVYLYGKR